MSHSKILICHLFDGIFKESPTHLLKETFLNYAKKRILNLI